MCVWGVGVHECRYSCPEEDTGFLSAGVMDICELPNVGTGNQIQVLFKISKCF